MPLVRKWNMFENNACMSVCVCVCVYVYVCMYACNHQAFFSRSLVCSKTVHFPLLRGPNNVRDQIALKIKLLSVVLSQEIFKIYHPKRLYVGL